MTEIGKPVKEYEAEPLVEPVPGNPQPAVPEEPAPAPLAPVEADPVLV